MKINKTFIALIIIFNIIASFAFDLIIPKETEDFAYILIFLIITLYFISIGNRFFIILQIIINSITILFPLAYFLFRLFDGNQMNNISSHIVLLCTSLTSFCLLYYLIKDKRFYSLKKKYLKKRILKMESELKLIDKD